MNDIFHTINQDHKLNENEKIIVQYMVDHLEDIPKLSSRELARRTYTSSTVIIRFIKKLGFENYNDFKLNIMSYLKNLRVPTTSIVSNEDMLSLVNKLSDIQIGTIQNTKEQLSLTLFSEIITLLSKTRYIDIIADDANICFGEYISHLLWSLGKVVNVYYESNKQLYLSLNVPQDHVVIIISRHGKTKHIINTATTLRKRNIHMIAITTQDDDKLLHICPLTYIIATPNISVNLRDMIFFTSLKYLFDLIYITLFSQNYDNALQIENVYNEIFSKGL
ncbi:MAG: MurR/RpiR family transcriptional regulator [Coprobacillus sp.]